MNRNGRARDSRLQDVRRLASAGEGMHIEFKRRVPEGSRLAKEISAFANSEGGRVLIGVDDSGEVLGVRDALEEEYSMQLALETYCYPQVPHQSERIPVSRRREVILVTVPESEGKPHYVVDPDEPNRRTAYVRVDDMSIEASKEAVRVMRLAQRTSDVRFEFGDKELKLMRYLEEYGRITVSQLARLAEIPKKQASQTLVILTRAGLLTLHSDPRGDFFTAARDTAA